MTDRVVVVGAGVAGLSAAHALLAAEPSLDVTVLEADERPGGRLRSVRVGNLDLEAGPDSFVARKPWAADLAGRLGLELAAPGATGALVWTERGLVPMPSTALGVPADIDELVRWRGLPRAARLRALSDLVRKPRAGDEDESIGALVRRRLGDEVAEVLVAPLLGGLFAGDVDRLGVRSTFPELAGWERDFGSLIRGAKAALAASGSAGPMFLKPVGGLTALVDALVSAVATERVRTASAAASIGAEGPAYVVRTGDGELPASSIVLATPAPAAARLLAEVSPGAAARLSEIAYVSTAVALLVYPDGTADGLPETAGFVVPAGKAPMTAATFLSRKWPDPAFGSRAVLRCFVGGAGAEDVLDARDEDIVEAVGRHLAAVLPLHELPAAHAVVRWPRSMPQYEVGHLDRVAAIERSLPAGIVVVGNAYRGIGIADTVRSAEEGAGAVLAHLTGRRIRTERVR
jgi:oxygen-dependent protoporphyrinogen oxidase